MIRLARTTKGDSYLRTLMARHYSQPKGFVGRQLAYRVYHGSHHLFGCICFGSAIKNLAGRRVIGSIQHGLNNTFFHCVNDGLGYPERNFTTRVLLAAERIAMRDYEFEYGDPVAWLETLVELPRTGDLYRKAGYREVGRTVGFTCKRIAGESSDTWTGKRVWDTTNLRPKIVFQKVITDGLEC